MSIFTGFLDQKSMSKKHKNQKIHTIDKIKTVLATENINKNQYGFKKWYIITPPLLIFKKLDPNL